jgi:lactate dehydrogenase-like 2-hydroxyacid dehydrogenase
MLQRIVITRRIPECGIKLLLGKFQVEVWPRDMPPSVDELRELVQEADGLACLLSDKVDDSILDVAGPRLKAIANFAVGYNNIDVAAAVRRGIQVGNTPDVLTDATADVAVGLIIGCARRFQESIDQVRRLEWKTWEPLGLIGKDLKDATLGIVGMGRIGLAVAQRLRRGWNMRVLYTARSPKLEIDSELQAERVEIDRLLAESDFVSLHTDLNPSTKHLINASRLRTMKPTAVLVNTARGGLIDQSALFEALKNRVIFAAGLDVTDPEPLPIDSPLRTLASCTILPHVGSATQIARDRMSMMVAENLIAALGGNTMPYRVA